MSPLGHIVEKCEESCHFCPQLPAPKGGLSREEETDEKAEA
nr:MAG TPA: 4Fe-4S single cluster domain protein [Caudoviricetes sp.]